MAIRFRIHALFYGESNCSGPAVITIFSVIAFKTSSDMYVGSVPSNGLQDCCMGIDPPK